MTKEKYKSKRRYVLALGHLCADMNQGVLAAILPFLIAAYHYDYKTAAMLVMVSNLVGSVIQPIFGLLADKKVRPAMMSVGVIMAGFGMALTGLVDNFGLLCIAVVISGVGTAMFHPQAAQLINRVSLEGTKGESFGIFALGGNLGFMFGPALVTACIAVAGLKGTLVLVVPSIVFTVVQILFFEAPAEGLPYVAAEKNGPAKRPKDDWPEFIKLALLVTGRSVIFSGINTFVVLFLISQMHLSESTGNIFLTFYYAVGSVSAVAGGKLADMIGHRKIIWISWGILVPSLFLFSMNQNIVIAAILLIPMGIGISMLYSPLVLSGQQSLPNHMGLASGVTLGLSVSIGGIVAPALGSVGDDYGLVKVFVIIACIAVVPMILSFFLKEERKQ
ncbi:MAG: MFS transporter [Clostridia bacterium]|nr:MFS transporter [Clostridia bacterium]